MVVVFTLTASLLFADQNLLAPNLSIIAREFHMDPVQRDRCALGLLAVTERLNAESMHAHAQPCLYWQSQSCTEGSVAALLSLQRALDLHRTAATLQTLKVLPAELTTCRYLGGYIAAAFFAVGAPAALLIGYLCDKVNRRDLLFIVVILGEPAEFQSHLPCSGFPYSLLSGWLPNCCPVMRACRQAHVCLLLQQHRSGLS